MNKKEFLFLGLVIYLGYRYQRSHHSQSAVDYAYNIDAAQFAQLAGTNFTQSLWDSTNGQPSYMWGAVPVAAQGGLATQVGGSIANVFGHM